MIENLRNQTIDFDANVHATLEVSDSVRSAAFARSDVTRDYLNRVLDDGRWDGPIATAFLGERCCCDLASLIEGLAECRALRIGWFPRLVDEVARRWPLCGLGPLEDTEFVRILSDCPDRGDSCPHRRHLDPFPPF